MAFAIPSNAYINMLMDTRKDRESAAALQRIVDNGKRFDAEDYRTVGTDRGPVRGLGGGSRRL